MIFRWQRERAGLSGLRSTTLEVSPYTRALSSQPAAQARLSKGIGSYERRMYSLLIYFE